MFTKHFVYFLIPIAIIFIAYQHPNVKLLYTVMTFFSESCIVENFRSMVNTTKQPYHTAHHGPVAEFKPGQIKNLPETFSHKNQTYHLEDWLKSHWTTGLVILKVESTTNARLLFESYYLGNTRETKTISWSVGKSVVSALIGIAISEGKIKSVEDNVTVYVPELKNTAYDGVKIKDVLQMSSGVIFDEDYDSFFSDINKMVFWIAIGGDIIDFVKTLHRDKEPGTVHNYISIDTQILGMVLKGAIGQSLTSYLEEKIWSKAGFESDCHWLLDNEKSAIELAFGTLNTCTRDYARFGWLYLNKGLSPFDGARLIDSDWINESITITSEHLKPNYPDRIGYGYQWWIPGKENDSTQTDDDYLAIGVYNQFIYVNPNSGIVIARNSANPNYNNEFDKINNVNVGETQFIAACRAIVKHYS